MRRSQGPNRRSAEPLVSDPCPARITRRSQRAAGGWPDKGHRSLSSLQTRPSFQPPPNDKGDTRSAVKPMQPVRTRPGIPDSQAEPWLLGTKARSWSQSWLVRESRARQGARPIFPRWSEGPGRPPGTCEEAVGSSPVSRWKRRKVRESSEIVPPPRSRRLDRS